MLKRSFIFLVPLMLTASGWQDALNTATSATAGSKSMPTGTTTSQTSATSGVKEAQNH